MIDKIQSANDIQLTLSGCTDYKTAAQIIKNGGYATDVKYVDKICSLIERWDLTRFDKLGRENSNMNIID